MKAEKYVNEDHKDSWYNVKNFTNNSRVDPRYRFRYNSGVNKKKRITVSSKLYTLVADDKRVHKVICDACAKEGLPSFIFKKILLEILEYHKKPNVVFNPTSLPGEAPDLYEFRGITSSGKRENIVDFLRRVWKPWIDQNLLSRSDLRRLDYAADKAIENWISAHKQFPEDVRVPTRKQLDDDIILSDPEFAKHDPRLSRIISNRVRRGVQIPGFTS